MGEKMKTLKGIRYILELEKNYSKKLQECYFVGEIVLTESELKDVGDYLREFVINESLNRVRNTLLVFSTNIAYFYYDEQGFWKHFCEALNIDYCDINTSYVGQMIEETLLEYDLISMTRRGPFRYVGAILEQTGITKRSIPVFSDIIKLAINNYRISNTITKSYEKYKLFIENVYCSKYLKDYLLDKSGWEFTIQVIKIIYYLEERLLKLDEIPEIKGFHPSFWVDFFQNYGAFNIKGKKVNNSINNGVKVEKDEKNTKPVIIKWHKEPDIDIKDINYKIFYDNIPDIYISNSGFFLGNNVLLFYDIGEGVKRIRDKTDFLKLKQEIKSKKACCGKLWVEYLDRKSVLFFNNKKILRFCVIPKAEILLPNDIYGNDEKILFKCTSPYIIFDKCNRNINDLEYYEVPPNLKILEGKIKISNKEIKFTHEIHRVEINIVDSKFSQFIDYNLENKNCKLDIKALPESIITFGFVSEGKFFILKDKIQILPSGEFTVNYQSISEAIKKVNPVVGQFAIINNEKMHFMNKGIISYSKLLDEFQHIKDLYKHINLIRKIDIDLEEKINILFRIYNYKEIAISLEKFVNDDIFMTLIYIAKTIDTNVKICDLKDEQIINQIFDEEIIKTMNWFKNSKFAIQKQNFKETKNLVKMFRNLKWIPTFNRWEQKIKELYVKLREYDDEYKTIEEWKKDVITNNLRFKSKISKLHYGKQLTRAWRKYQSYEFTQSLNILKLIDYSEDEMIILLKNILICIIYTRNLRIKSLEKIVKIKTYDNCLQTIIEFYKNIYLLITNDTLDVQIDIEDKLLESLPMLEEDIIMIKRLKLLFNYYKDENCMKNFRSSDNWLELLILYKLYKLYKSNSNKSKFYYNKLKLLIEKLPYSPEKSQIFKEFY